MNRLLLPWLASAILLGAADQSWWLSYGDSQLNTLVDKALAQNLDLRAATQRIAAARAVAATSRSALLPAVNFTTGAQRLRGGFQQGIARIPEAPGETQGGAFVAPFETNILQAGLDMRWELDLFGGNRAALAASRADVEAGEQLRQDLAITISAEVARAYAEVRGIEERIAITERNRDAQRDLLDLTKSRAEAGLALHLDVERQTTLLANTEAVLPALANERAVRLNRLAVLTGETRIAVERATQPLQTPPLATTVDAAVLRRRPDVRAADARLQAALARLQSARTDRYPKIVLNGLSGRQGTSFAGLSLGGGNFFSIGPQLQLPLFSGGRIRANINRNDALVEEARTRYQQEILIAFEEAENAIAGYREQQARTAKLQDALQAAERALALSEDRNQAGLDDFLAVLDAQREVFQAQLQHVEAHTSALVESVRLYKALAGGWPQP
ncbi:MAG: efflux transporter outer membrane subunit [Bryobacterales bacterium]|nr:efflux transporter outer membrane subunit [Bryobacterales bacterium]